jgi:hypothetical protein
MDTLETIIRQRIVQYEEEESRWNHYKSGSTSKILMASHNAEMYHDMANDLKLILREAGLVA